MLMHSLVSGWMPMPLEQDVQVSESMKQERQLSSQARI